MNDLRGVAPLLQVYDMPRSLRFYRDLLGFVVVDASPKLAEDYHHWVLLRQGESELMLNTAYEFDDERPTRPDPARVTGHSDVTLYFGCPDVDGAYELFRNRGLALAEPSLTRYGFRQIGFKDPDGYGLCFHWPASGDSAAVPRQ